MMVAFQFLINTALKPSRDGTKPEYKLKNYIARYEAESKFMHFRVKRMRVYSAADMDTELEGDRGGRLLWQVDQWVNLNHSK